MQKLFALPTFTLSQLLPSSHPFKQMSLDRWARGRTTLCKWFDGALWYLCLLSFALTIKALL